MASQPRSHIFLGWVMSMSRTPKADGTLPYVIAARVTAGEKDNFRDVARQLSMPESQLARRLLFGSLNRVKPPPVVPEVNREAWLDLASSVDIFDQAVRALETGRLESLDGVILRATIEAAAAVETLRRLRYVLQRFTDVPLEMEARLDRMLDAARGVSAALHALRTLRADELDGDRVEAVGRAVAGVESRLGEVRRLLLGGVRSGPA